MKTLKLVAILAVTGMALLFAACSETERIDESLAMADKSADWALAAGDSCTYEGVLSDEEADGLLHMLEEEKLARDVYLYLATIYSESIFQNIAKSEQAHMNAVESLLVGYEVVYPELGEEGVFNDPDFTTLYSTLTQEGETGLEAALGVGIKIEELDIADLKELLGEIENADVIRVYTNLLSGSENHLKAFTNVLNGETPAGGNGNYGNGQGNTNGVYGNSNSGNGTGVCDGTQSGTQNAGMNGNSNSGDGTGVCDGTQAGPGTPNGNQGSNGNGNSNGRG